MVVMKSPENLRFTPGPEETDVLVRFFSSGQLLIPAAWSETIAVILQALRRVHSRHINGEWPEPGDGILMTEDVVRVLEALEKSDVTIPISWVRPLARLFAMADVAGLAQTTGATTDSPPAEAHREPATETTSSPSTDGA